MGSKYDIPRVATYVTLFLATAAFPATASAAPPDEYVVYVDEAALRAEPSDDAEVREVLTRDARVTNLSEVVAEVEGCYWRQVKADGAVGWVADADVIPAYFYDPFAEADERGRAGDAEGMLTGVVKGLRAVLDVVMYSSPNFYLSPDGSKVLVNLGDSRVMPTTWAETYGSSVSREPVPLMIFATGRGLARYALVEGYLGRGEWFPDSRHFVYPTRSFNAGLLDVDTGEQVDLGVLYWLGGWWEHEIIGEFVVWPGYEKPENPPTQRPDAETPVLLAYDVSTGETLRLLEADPATIRDMDRLLTPGAWYDYYEVKMVPAAAVPEALRRSELYEKYNGAYALARESWA